MALHWLSSARGHCEDGTWDLGEPMFLLYRKDRERIDLEEEEVFEEDWREALRRVEERNRKGRRD